MENEIVISADELFELAKAIHSDGMSEVSIMFMDADGSTDDPACLSFHASKKSVPEAVDYGEIYSTGSAAF